MGNFIWAAIFVRHDSELCLAALKQAERSEKIFKMIQKSWKLIREQTEKGWQSSMLRPSLQCAKRRRPSQD